MRRVENLRLAKDSRDRVLVLWNVGREHHCRRYADVGTAQAIMARVAENGSPDRGFAR